MTCWIWAGSTSTAGRPGANRRTIPARPLPVEPELEVLKRKGVNIDRILIDHPVIRPVSQGGPRPGDHVDEAPDEFLERGGLTLTGQLPGNSSTDLRRSGEVTDGVVPSRLVGIPQVEHEELPAGHGRFDVTARHQACISLGIEDDDDIAAPDVLGNEHLSEPGLADARCPEHEHVAWSLDQIHADFGFLRLQAVNHWIAADWWKRGDRVPPCVPPGLSGYPSV